MGRQRFLTKTRRTPRSHAEALSATLLLMLGTDWKHLNSGGPEFKCTKRHHADFCDKFDAGRDPESGCAWYSTGCHSANLPVASGPSRSNHPRVFKFSQPRIFSVTGLPLVLTSSEDLC
jgi:hypothetical protein